MSNFQLIVLGFFGFFLIIGVLIFSGFLPGLRGPDGADLSGQVVIWGTLPEGTLSALINDFNRDHKPVEVIYVAKSADTFDRELLEALASSRGPDIIMLPHELTYRYADKVYPIPLSSYSARDFKNAFIEEGEIFLTSGGILALPFTIDPMIMYWNRDIFSNAGIALPPETWEEVLAVTSKLTQKDPAGNITKSAIGMGEFRNVNYAKDILSMLVMQAGDSIVSTKDNLKVTFGDQFDFTLKPAEEAFRFYSEFSNPVKKIYSWNKSLPRSRDAFISGNLAMYFGYASELFPMRERNPHLNFDIKKVPQSGGAGNKLTFGRLNGLAVLKSAPNIASAVPVAFLLTNTDFASKLVGKTFLPPPRRDLLSKQPADAYFNVFFEGALLSRAWLDPNPSETSAIFQRTLDNIISGRLRSNEAILEAKDELTRLFPSII